MFKSEQFTNLKIIKLLGGEMVCGIRCSRFSNRKWSYVHKVLFDEQGYLLIGSYNPFGYLGEVITIPNNKCIISICNTSQHFREVFVNTLNNTYYSEENENNNSSSKNDSTNYYFDRNKDSNIVQFYPNKNKE